MQQLDFTLFKKTMLFASEKIGETTVQLHNATSGSQTDWLILTNEKDEIVGKLLAYIEIKKDIASKQIRQIQNDLKMRDSSLNVNSNDTRINKDMTEDKGMPLCNHEQVLLLNDRSEPQTHITHQTQNSAIAIGSIGKSPKLSRSITGGQQQRATPNSMMSVTNITHVSNPAVGVPHYLDTTNIFSSNKVNKSGKEPLNRFESREDGGYGAMTQVINNQTEN